MCRLKAEFKRVTEERDILKKSGGVLRSSVRLKYALRYGDLCNNSQQKSGYKKA